MFTRGGKLVAALIVSLRLATPASAEDIDAPPVADASRPAVGQWIGEVSWNDQRIAYAWFINSDGTFSSGRASRGPSGGGAWSANGAHLILKYTNGFRYVGELHQDTFGGTAYLANGQSFGAFSMSRSVGPKSDD